jgi:hypothetical protein
MVTSRAQARLLGTLAKECSARYALAESPLMSIWSLPDLFRWCSVGLRLCLALPCLACARKSCLSVHMFLQCYGHIPLLTTGSEPHKLCRLLSVLGSVGGGGNPTPSNHLGLVHSLYNRLFLV